MNMFNLGRTLRRANAVPCWLAMRLPHRVMSGWVHEELIINAHHYAGVEEELAQWRPRAVTTIYPGDVILSEDDLFVDEQTWIDWCQKGNTAMTKRLYSKAKVEWIVDRLHVGVIDEEIRANIEKRATHWPPIQRALAVKDALNRHKRNRRLYSYVMSGGR